MLCLLGTLCCCQAMLCSDVSCLPHLRLKLSLQTFLLIRCEGYPLKICIARHDITLAACYHNMFFDGESDSVYPKSYHLIDARHDSNFL